MRRSLTVLLLIAIVCGIGWWLWRWQAQVAPPTDPWSMVPKEAVAVLEVPEPLAAWGKATGTSQFWGDLEEVPLFAGVNAVLTRFAEAAAGQATQRAEGPPLLITWNANGGDSLAMLLAWPMPATSDVLQALGAAMRTQLPSTLWTGTVLTVRPDSVLPAMELAWERGLLLISPDKALLRKALEGKGRESFKDSLFHTARASFSAGADAHLLVRPSYASSLLALDGEGIFPQDADVQGWAALDVRVRPGAVLMNGLFFPQSESPATSAINHQRSARPEIIKVLPANVCRLRAMQVEDPAGFVRDINGKEPDEQLFAAYGAWVHGTMGVAEGPQKEDSTGLSWAVFATQDPGKALAAITARCADNGCPATEYRGIAIRQTADEGALAALFGKPFTPFRRPLFSVLSDMVVMSGTPAGMRAAIDAFTDRNSLALDPRSGDFFQRFGSDAVYSWWADMASAYTAAESPLAKARQATGGALFQLSPRSDGAFVATFCLQHAPMGKRAAGTLWTTALGALLEGPPILLKDYLSKTLQVLAQDRDHRVSLISCTGKVLWQRPLDGPLLGGVQLVDRYRNGKLQMLCNTAGKVYLIDRLGRDVEGFPVNLKDSACAPLGVFDYENRKDYRVLVPTENGGILNLGIDGKPVSGWAPKPLPSPAAAAVEHVRNKGKDYLVVAMQDGRVAVLDRRGEERYAVKLRMAHIAAFLGSREAMDIGDRRMLWADSAGAVLSGTLDGKVDTLSPASSGRAAIFDVNGDGHDDILRTTMSSLSAEQGTKAIFRATFPDSPQAAAFPVAMESGEAAVGIVLPEQDQVRLYTKAGDLWPGFPMKGAMQFSVADINLDGVPELVTADSDGVVTVYALPPGR